MPVLPLLRTPILTSTKDIDFAIALSEKLISIAP